MNRFMTAKIYHCNDAHQELANMELPSRRILYICLSRLQRERDVDTGVVTIKFNPDEVFAITALEYSQVCNIDISEAYKQLKEGIVHIQSYIMRIPESVLHPEGRGKPKDWMNIFTVASDGGYSDGEGFIEVKLSSKFAPYISDLTKEFTGQFLLSAVQLPKGNAYSLYLLLCKWVSSGKSAYCDIDVDELKRELGATGACYERFNTFDNSFFKRAVKQVLSITEFTNVELEIIERRARKANKVRISYKFSKPTNNENGLIVQSPKAENKLRADKVKLSPSEKFRNKVRQSGKIPTF